MSHKQHKLTLGLLVSMSMRYDHSFLSPLFGIGLIEQLQGTMNLSQVAKKRVELLHKMLQVYKHIISGITAEAVPVDPISLSQLTEEVNGSGFYSVERDSEYVSGLDLSQHELIQLRAQLGISTE
jgi:hypothetical protein